LGNINCVEAIGEFSRVEFVVEGHLHCILGECHRGEGGLFGVYSCDACDEEICLLEVEEGERTKAEMGSCGVYFGFACDELADGSVG
jgi:hypothetical protein